MDKIYSKPNFSKEISFEILFKKRNKFCAKVESSGPSLFSILR